MSRRNAAIAVGILALAALAAVLALYVTRTETPLLVAISPTPTATGTAPPSPTPTATSTAAPTATTPSAAATGVFISAGMGYALDVRPPWHRSVCGSSISGGPAESTDGVDLFIAVPDADFRLGHIGPFGGTRDTIHVRARANPNDLQLREWVRTQIGDSRSQQVVDTTFSGRPALLVTEPNDPGAGRGQAETFVFANAGYVWEVGHRLIDGSSALADRAAIVRSFRFLSADEQRAARATATPSPAPRTPEQVADLLAEGFAKRDLATLGRVIRPCIYEAVYNSGPESMPAATYLEELRERFAQGLVVEVRARPISGDAATTLKIRSTWRQPGETMREADLTMTVHRGTTYWDGTITCIFACP